MFPKCLLLIVLVLAPLWARASEDLASRWGYDQVINLIKERKAQNHPVKTLDELLRLLPRELKEHFTLVFNSKTILQDASPMYPRAIVFNGRMYYTFNGHPSQRGYDTMEVMEFEPISRKFELREITFPKSGSGGEVAYDQKTPAKCMGCHGLDPKPIWNEYSDWPGVYGSQDDTPTGQELSNLLKFRANLAANRGLRYNQLIFPKGSKSSPYQEPNKDDNAKFRPNLALTKLFTRENALRLARIMSTAPNDSSLGDIAFYALAEDILEPQCSDKIPQFAALSNQVFTRLNEAVKQTGLGWMEGQARVPQILALLGIDVTGYSISRERPGFSFSDGQSDQETLLASAVMRNWESRHPEYQGLFMEERRFTAGDDKGQSLAPLTDSLLSPLEDPTSEACDALLKTTQESLQKAWKLQPPL